LCNGGYKCKCDCKCAIDKIDENKFNFDNGIFENDYINLFYHNYALYEMWLTYEFTNNNTVRTLQPMKGYLEENILFDEDCDCCINRKLINDIYKEIGYGKLIDHLLIMSQNALGKSAVSKNEKFRDKSFIVISLSNKHFRKIFQDYTLGWGTK